MFRLMDLEKEFLCDAVFFAEHDSEQRHAADGNHRPRKEFIKALEGAGTLSKRQAAFVKSEAVIRLRQKSSLLKLEDSIELCLELLDNGRQVAISCEFLATMDAMEEVLRKKKISYARVHGRCTNNSHLKEAERLRYQRGDAPVILFNVVEGISLHEGETNNGGNNVPRCQIDHDLRWSAIQAHQIDGRSHRDGKFAQVYWVVAKDTIDSRVAEVLLGKLESMGNLQGDSTKDFEEILSRRRNGSSSGNRKRTNRINLNQPCIQLLEERLGRLLHQRCGPLCKRSKTALVMTRNSKRK
jgi:hypothetical protein